MTRIAELSAVNLPQRYLATCFPSESLPPNSTTQVAVALNDRSQRGISHVLAAIRFGNHRANFSTAGY